MSFIFVLPNIYNLCRGVQIYGHFYREALCHVVLYLRMILNDTFSNTQYLFTSLARNLEIFKNLDTDKKSYIFLNF